MKKILLVVVLAIVSLTTVAQSRVGQLTIQPKVGLSISDLTNVTNSDSRVGAVVGAELEYGIARNVSFNTGLLYSMQGAKDDHGSLELDYLNIPVVFNFYVAKNFALKTGLQLGFNVDDDGTNAKSVDLSLPLGLSYQFGQVVLDGRYNLGLTKVYRDVDWRNSVFQITLGYKFAL